MTIPASIARQYTSAEPLKIRIETHRKFEERRVDLDVESRRLLRLSGDEAILDVGCGPGLFPRFLRMQEHHGLLLGLDQSSALIAEASATASESGLPTCWILGVANALPFPDRTFQRVVARHMLYHVRDIPGALREFGRVVTPEGILLFTTNSRSSLPRIDELIEDCFNMFGLSRPPFKGVSFSIENARAILSEVYPAVEEIVMSNALVFSSPRPIVEYISTGFPGSGLSDDLVASMQQWLLEETGRRLSRLGGIWRDPKDVGFYVCRVRG
jgi:ubiquinone/menaquinone biosynthesis C-methylase UbiE